MNLRSPWWEPERVLSSLDYTICAKMNVDELQRLARGDRAAVLSREELAGLAGAFKQQHNIVTLLLTQGEQGALLVGADGECRSAPSPAPHGACVMDTVGAGDAFTAVVILGLQNAWDWPVILDRAQQFASFIVTQRGAICSNPKVYRDFRELWHIL